MFKYTEFLKDYAPDNKHSGIYLAKPVTNEKREIILSGRIAKACNTNKAESLIIY